MSILKDKKDIFTNLSSIISFNSSRQKQKTNTNLDSLSNNKNGLSFLLDLLKILLGTGGLLILLGKLIGNVFNKTKPLIISQLNNNLISPLSDTLIQNTYFNNGIVVPIKVIDPYNNLKSNYNSIVGNLIFGDVGTNTFDYKLYEIINTIGSGNINNIHIEYNENDDTLTINAINKNQTVSNFYNVYLDEDDYITKKSFVANIIDNIFGTKSNNLNKKQNIIIEELKNKLIINKSLNEENLIIHDYELNNIETISKNIENGLVKLDFGCGEFDASLNIESLSEFSELLNTNNENEVINNIENLFDETLNNENNCETSKDMFYNDLINNFRIELSNSFLLSTKIIILNLINKKINNNITQQEIDNLNTSSYISSNQDVMECMNKVINNEINQTLFNIVKRELNNLLIPFSKAIFREKINQYSGIIRSLLGFS